MKKTYITVKIVALTIIFIFMGHCAISSSLDSISQSISTALGSISTSLESISDSLRSSSESISDSLSSDEKSSNRDFQDNVSLLTVLTLKENLSSHEFTRELSRIARNYGIIDWERNPHTYIGIGKGLKISGIHQRDFADFIAGVSHPEMKQYLQKGFQE